MKWTNWNEKNDCWFCLQANSSNALSWKWRVSILLTAIDCKKRNKNEQKWCFLTIYIFIFACNLYRIWKRNTQHVWNLLNNAHTQIFLPSFFRYSHRLHPALNLPYLENVDRTCMNANNDCISLLFTFYTRWKIEIMNE